MFDMANADLAQYVKEQIKAGYNPEQIKSTLMKQGYKKNIVDEAVRKAKTNIPLLYIAIALVILIIVVLTVLVYLKITPEEMKVPEKIEEKIPSEKITEKTEVQPSQIPIPPAEQIPAMEAEEEQELGTSFKIEEIKEISLTNADRAEALCGDLGLRTEKDLCYLSIAGSAAKPDMCAKISNIMTRDQCYLDFAAAGIDACDQIQNNATRKACNQMITITSR